MSYHMREMMGGAMDPQYLDALRAQREAFVARLARLRRDMGQSTYEAQAASDRYRSAAASQKFEPYGRERIEYPKRRRTMGPASMTQAQDAMSDAAHTRHRNRSVQQSVADVEGRIQAIDRQIANLEAVEAAESMIELSKGDEQKGSGIAASAPVQVLQVSAARVTRKPVIGEPHVGASAPKIIAGTGRIAPAPGYHYMATGELMKDPE